MAASRMRAKTRIVGRMPGQDGLETEWDKNGTKRSEGHCKNDKPDGLWTEWYENGQKNSETHYKDGKFVSASVWKPDGEPCPITKFVDGSGIMVQYHENGKKELEAHYKNGKEVRQER
jgi:antitoxin component YwqK of YwqJK toxin-antitoxin module